MPSSCGVEWSGTSGGKLDESAIPDSPDHKPHYLNSADTKSDSSFPVVDGEGNLRAGNVNAAWDLRNQGEGVSEECLRNLDGAFDENVLPDSAYENAEHGRDDVADVQEWQTGDMVQWVPLPQVKGQIVHVDTERKNLMVELMKEDDGGLVSSGHTITAGYSDVQPIEGMDMEAEETETERARPAFSESDTFGITTEFSVLPSEALADGFNKYGVRVNEDGSVDVRFNVMEPGVRKGIEIEPEFLQTVAGYDYDRVPLQVDHSESQLANVGYVGGDNIKFASDGVLRAQAHIPNTGSDVRDDVIADFTHDPPQITDISVGFNPDAMEVERPSSRDGNPRFVDGRIREFSLTPFPAGYDNGGLTPEFSEGGAADASKLIKRPHLIIRKYD